MLKHKLALFQTVQSVTQRFHHSALNALQVMSFGSSNAMLPLALGSATNILIKATQLRLSARIATTNAKLALALKMILALLAAQMESVDQFMIELLVLESAAAQ